ncbi:MAG: hypothetical protein HY514_02080 [Candidatus Aenigmarchaeota archaeon]|nr:hypothetical protein [Candidatus Aenigmarchaeota archaeon]
MEEPQFELLLAMMRLLKREDQLGLLLETGIINIIDNFSPSFGELQRAALSKEFVRYESLLAKKKEEEKTMEKIESEEYKKVVSDYVKGAAMR